MIISPNVSSIARSDLQVGDLFQWYSSGEVFVCLAFNLPAHSDDEPELGAIHFQYAKSPFELSAIPDESLLRFGEWKLQLPSLNLGYSAGSRGPTLGSVRLANGKAFLRACMKRDFSPQFFWVDLHSYERTDLRETHGIQFDNWSIELPGRSPSEPVIIFEKRAPARPTTGS